MAHSSSYQRLLQLLNEYLQNDPRKSVSSFEHEFGLSNGYFRNRNIAEGDDEDKRLFPKTIRNIHSAQPLLNIKWLEDGTGEPWFKDETENFIEAKKVGRPYYNIDFLGGFDIMFNDQSAVPESYISMEPYNKDGYYWCNLTGDSMSPLIKSGAKICLKYVQDGVNGIIYGDVYALVTKSDMRTVKWVVRANDETKIRLVPENKDPKFGDYQDIPKIDVMQVFKVELAVNPM